MTSEGALFRRFHGRRRELTALVAAARNVREESRGRSVLIAGEPGVGKTRLLSELRSIMERDGCAVLRGAAVTYISAPFTAMLDALNSDRCAPGEVVDALASVGTDRELDAQTDRLRRFTTVENYLRRRASVGGVVLIAEDLHWSDAATLDLLAFLTHRLSDAAVFIVGSYRTPEVSADVQLASSLLRIQREGASVTQLDALSDADILAAIGETIPATLSISQAEIASICSLAEGRPFVAEELLRTSMLRTVSSREEDFAALSLRTSVLERLSGFSPTERAALYQAAVLGREFDATLLARVTDRPLAEIANVLSRARSAQLLIELPDGSRFAFRHAITREVLYHELLALDVRALHARAAEALQAVDADAEAGDIAYHLWAAGAPEAADWNERAGDRAAQLHAYADAALFYERALDVAAKESPEYPKLLKAVTFALCTTGDIDRARTFCEEAARAFRERGLGGAALRQMLYVARQFYEVGDVTSARATLAAVNAELDLAPSDDVLFAASVQAAAFDALQGQAERSLRTLDEAEQIAGPRGPTDDCLAANARGLAYYALERFDEALGSYERARLLAESVDRADLAAHFCGNIAGLASHLGRTKLADASYARAVNIARERGHARVLILMLADHSLELAISGQLERARAACDEALISRHASIMGQLAANAADVRLRTLTIDEDEVPGPELLALFTRVEEYGEPQMLGIVGGEVARAFAVAERGEEAAEIVRRVLRAPGGATQTSTLCDVAASVAEAHDLERAARLVIESASASNPAALAHRLLFDARRAQRVGDTESAAMMGLQAAELFATFPWPAEQAAALEVATRPRDALEVFRSIGASRQVRRLEDALGIRRSTKTRALGVLSRREEQVAVLLARGRSYRAIADELGIGERTVETHASSAYRKLGVKTRIDLAARLRDLAS